MLVADVSSTRVSLPPAALSVEEGGEAEAAAADLDMRFVLHLTDLDMRLLHHAYVDLNLCAAFMSLRPGIIPRPLVPPNLMPCVEAIHTVPGTNVVRVTLSRHNEWWLQTAPST